MLKKVRIVEAQMDAAVEAFLHDERRPAAAVEVASVKAFVERSNQAVDDFDDDEPTAPTGRVRSAISTERAPDHIAPDGTELRELMPLGDGELWHATLDPGSVSHPVRHKQVTERWLFTGGEGELWLKRADGEEVLVVRRGVVVSISPGVAFQFKSTSATALEFFGRTTPKFPGPHEAEPVAGRWRATG